MIARRDSHVRGTRDYAPRTPLLSDDEQQTPPSKKRCRECGAILAHDNKDKSGLCSPCSRSRRRPAPSQQSYNARHDPEFVSAVARLLIDNYGHSVRIGRQLGADVWVVREAVKELRTRWGFVVDAVKGSPGYTLVDWRRPAQLKKRGRPPGRKRTEKAS